MEKNKEELESWYAIYIVIALLCLGLFSIMYLNFILKIVGVITVIGTMSVLIAIFKKKEDKNGK